MKKIKAWVNGDDFHSRAILEQDARDILKHVGEGVESFFCLDTTSKIQHWIRCKDVDRIEIIEVGEEKEIKVGGTE